MQHTRGRAGRHGVLKHGGTAPASTTANSAATSTRYGMTLDNVAGGSLDLLGILGACQALSTRSACHWVFSGSDAGAPACGYYGKALVTNRGDSPPSKLGANLRVPRQELRRVLLERLAPGTVKWGMGLQSYTELGADAGADNGGGDGGERGVLLRFVDGTTMLAAALVGADGLRSHVRQLRDEQFKSVGAPTANLKPLGVSVIIGLSPYTHPLTTAQGFYVLDGTARLFTMPYSESDEAAPASGVGGGGGGGGVRAGGVGIALTMWQLSFAEADADAATVRLRGRKDDVERGTALVEEAVSRVRGWDADLSAMATQLISSTRPEDVWGTPLYDRNAMTVASERDPSLYGSLVTVLGDAAHPMSMFKGQGANMAMADASLLSQWIAGEVEPGIGGGGGSSNSGGGGGGRGGGGGSSGSGSVVVAEGDPHHPFSPSPSPSTPSGLPGLELAARLRHFEKEMMKRSAAKQGQSRAAAQKLHSEAALVPGADDFAYKLPRPKRNRRRMHADALASKLRQEAVGVAVACREGLVAFERRFVEIANQVDIELEAGVSEAEAQRIQSEGQAAAVPAVAPASDGAPSAEVTTVAAVAEVAAMAAAEVGPGSVPKKVRVA